MSVLGFLFWLFIGVPILLGLLWAIVGGIAMLLAAIFGAVAEVRQAKRTARVCAGCGREIGMGHYARCPERQVNQ